MAQKRRSPRRQPREAAPVRGPLLAVDGDSFAHRAYHGLPKTIQSRGGRPGGAIVGFANSLIRLYQGERPRAVLVAWDTFDRPTYRHSAFPAYQSGRHFDHALLEQLEVLPRFVAACGLANAKAPGYEADDFLAAAAAEEERRGGTAVVASGDRDTFLQGNRVKKSCGDETCEEVVVPRGDFAAEPQASGIGNYTIVRRLNENRVPSFGRSGRWATSYVAKVLANRSVLDEFQGRKKQDKTWVPDGEPIADYFPRIIEDELFNRVYQARHERMMRGIKAGRKGNNVSNLFIGIARCAYCSSTMHYENRGRNCYLFFSGARNGMGCIKHGWNYSDFEKSFLSFVSEIDLHSILNSERQEQERLVLQNEITSLQGRVTAIDEKLEATFDLLSKSNSEFLGKKISQLETERSAISDAIQKHEQELQGMASPTITRDELKDIIAELQSSTDSYKLRSEVAQKLRSIISSLYIASVGTAPLIQMAKAKNDDDDVIAFMARMPETARFFSVKFKVGAVRVVEPNPDDPLDYEQHISTSDDVHEAGTISINLEDFYRR